MDRCVKCKKDINPLNSIVNDEGEKWCQRCLLAEIDTLRKRVGELEKRWAELKSWAIEIDGLEIETDIDMTVSKIHELESDRQW